MGISTRTSSYLPSRIWRKSEATSIAIRPSRVSDTITQPSLQPSTPAISMSRLLWPAGEHVFAIQEQSIFVERFQQPARRRAFRYDGIGRSPSGRYVINRPSLPLYAEQQADSFP